MPLHLQSRVHRDQADLWAPRLPFARRPPQSNCPPNTVLQRDNRQSEAWMPNREVFHERCQIGTSLLRYTNSTFKSMLSCSKAPRGLFVLLRVGRIFTAISISPGWGLRECSSRDAFHAGRNLPDKGFRYLRTVIVTAAVHPGLGSSLSRPKGGISLSLNRRALGRRRPPYITLRFKRRPVFLLNSRLSLVIVTPPKAGHPFSRSYGANLPSSLTLIIPIALEFSSCLPVSVCGTDILFSP